VVAFRRRSGRNLLHQLGAFALDRRADGQAYEGSLSFTTIMPEGELLSTVLIVTAGEPVLSAEPQPAPATGRTASTTSAEIRFISLPSSQGRRR
jgi:hypothetical protein